MKPPPPIFPADGYETAKANSVAIIASKALPPFLRISTPILLASSLAETTIAFLVRRPSFGLLQEKMNINRKQYLNKYFNVDILSEFTNSIFYSSIIKSIFAKNNYNATYKIYFRHQRNHWEQKRRGFN